MEERKQAEEAIHQGRVYARTLYDRLLIMFQMVDQDGKLIIGVSDQWLQVLGYTRHEVLQRACTDFMTPASRQLLQTTLLPQLFQSGELKEIACTLVKKSGESLEVLLSAIVERDQQGAIRRWFMVLTDGAQGNQGEKILLAIRGALAPDQTPDQTPGQAPNSSEEFFPLLVQNLADMLQVRHALVTECANRTMTRVRTLAYVQGQQLVENIEYDLDGTPCEGVIGGSICYYPQRLSEFFAMEAGQESYLGVPCYDSHGNLLGHLAVVNDVPMNCEPQDLAIMEIFAARAGAEIERKQAEERAQHSQTELSQINEQLEAYNRDLARKIAEHTHELDQRRRVAESLRDLLTILNSNQPVSEILDYIIGAATQLLGTTSGAIYALQADQKTLTVQATRGLPAAYVTNLQFSSEQCFLGQAVVKRQPVIVSNIAATLAEQNVGLDEQRQALLAQHYQTLLTVPLLRKRKQGEPEKLYGGIALYYPERRTFSDEEIGLVVAFAAQAALAIENAQLRQQAEQTAIMGERSRLARDLHDSVTQSLYSMTLLTEGWRRLAVTGRLEKVEDHLAELCELSRQALKEMRLLVHELLPPALEKEGLLGALHQRLAAVEKRSGVDARLIAAEVLELPPILEAGLYRIAQEALNNSIKHAEATAVAVTLRTDGPQIVLEISDNGKGFDLQALSGADGFGLTSMRERAEKLGGTLKVQSSPGRGTTVQVWIDKTMLLAHNVY